MKRWLTLGFAMALVLLALSLTTNSQSRAQGDQPAPAPIANPGGTPAPVALSPADAAQVRAEISTYLNNLQSLLAVLQQSPIGQQAIQQTGMDPNAVIAKAEQALPNLTPTQLAKLGSDYNAIPNWQQQPEQIKNLLTPALTSSPPLPAISSLGKPLPGGAPGIAGSSAVSGASHQGHKARPQQGAQASPSDANSTPVAGTFTNDCQTALGAGADPGNLFNASAYFYTSWALAQALNVSAGVTAALAPFAADTLTALETDPEYEVAVVVQTALGAANLALQQVLAISLDCESNYTGGTLYTPDPNSTIPNTFLPLATQQDVAAVGMSSVLNNVTPNSTSCSDAELDLPAKYGGQLDAVQQFVANIITDMQNAGQKINAALQYQASGNEAYQGNQWKMACVYYALAYQQAAK